MAHATASFLGFLFPPDFFPRGPRCAVFVSHSGPKFTLQTLGDPAHTGTPCVPADITCPGQSPSGIISLCACVPCGPEWPLWRLFPLVSHDGHLFTWNQCWPNSCVRPVVNYPGPGPVPTLEPVTMAPRRNCGWATLLAGFQDGIFRRSSALIQTVVLELTLRFDTELETYGTLGAI